MIKVICFGKIKERYLEEGINDYLTRIKKYHKIEIIELKDDNNILKEDQALEKYLNNSDYKIALDIQGTKVSSVSLATLIEQRLMYNSNITFIIGSSNGLSNQVLNKVDYKMSFGDITMPHGLFRLVLLEQIYRGFKIINNERYHK